MEVTLKEVAERLQVPPETLRPLLAAGLLPAEKRAGTWWLNEAAAERLVQVFRLLRRPYFRIPDGKDTPACPNCHQPGFRLAEYGDQWQCAMCRFNIPQQELRNERSLAQAVLAHRERSQSPNIKQGTGGWRHAIDQDYR